MEVQMNRPIMLWMTSRSRSSLVSQIFINHGVWWGDTPAQISGYEMNENQNIKNLLKKFKTKYWKKIHLTPVSPQWNQEFETKLEQIVPPDKTWMMKTGVEYYNAFQGLNPYNIFIRRPARDVATSLSNKRSDVTFEDAYIAAKWRTRYMNDLREEYGGVDVHTDRILEGDFSEIKHAIEYCGLEFDEDVARRAIIR